MDNQIECPVILLASGQTLKVRRVRLYEEDRVSEIAVLRAQAVRGMGGVSTGIGFWGSPGWALGGAAALGLVEGILSNSARKQAVFTMQAVAEKSRALIETAVYFRADRLEDGDNPHPQSWYARARSTVDVGQFGWNERNAFLARHQKKKHDLVDGRLEIVKGYVHDGDEFVHVETDVGRMSVRWQHVVAYSPPQNLSARDEPPSLPE